jgi:hypothetical protein
MTDYETHLISPPNFAKTSKILAGQMAESYLRMAGLILDLYNSIHGFVCMINIRFNKSFTPMQPKKTMGQFEGDMGLDTTCGYPRLVSSCYCKAGGSRLDFPGHG